MTSQQLISQIDEITTEFKKQFGSLTHTQLNWKPGPTVWSIAQNIHHLIVINETYYPVLKSVRESTYDLPWIGKFDFMVNFMGKIILNSVNPDRRKKMKTFPLWEPSKSDLPADILQKFINHQEDLKKLIHDSDDLLQKGTIISSPANKNIVYKLSMAFEIIVTHERRHLAQAMEVLSKQTLR